MNANERLTGRQDRALGGGVGAPVTMTADECKRLCDKLNKEYLPGYEGRILNYITTNESKDRYGDIVRAAGADLKSYLKNPVVMFSHQHDNFPVGFSLTIKPDKVNKNIPAQALFLDERVDSSGRSDLVYKFAKSRMMPSCSIGFLPQEVNQPVNAEERMALGLGQFGVEYTKWEYLEFSPCSIPANPEALQNALKSMDRGVSFELRDFELISKTGLMLPNLLDMFAESFKVASIIVIPKAVEEVPVPALPVVPVELPPAKKEIEVDVKVNVDADEIKKVFEEMKRLTVELSAAVETVTKAIALLPPRARAMRGVDASDAERSMYDILKL